MISTCFSKQKGAELIREYTQMKMWIKTRHKERERERLVISQSPTIEGRTKVQKDKQIGAGQCYSALNYG